MVTCFELDISLRFYLSLISLVHGVIGVYTGARNKFRLFLRSVWDQLGMYNYLVHSVSSPELIYQALPFTKGYHYSVHGPGFFSCLLEILFIFLAITSGLLK